jgi:hypothetical protein
LPTRGRRSAPFSLHRDLHLGRQPQRLSVCTNSNLLEARHRGRRFVCGHVDGTDVQTRVPGSSGSAPTTLPRAPSRPPGSSRKNLHPFRLLHSRPSAPRPLPLTRRGRGSRDSTARSRAGSSAKASRGRGAALLARPRPLERKATRAHRMPSRPAVAPAASGARAPHPKVGVGSSVAESAVLSPGPAGFPSSSRGRHERMRVRPALLHDPASVSRAARARCTPLGYVAKPGFLC